MTLVTDNHGAVTAVLCEARSLIRQYGWVQFDFGDKSCGFCAEGAVRAARSPNHTTVAHHPHYEVCTPSEIEELALQRLQQAATSGETLVEWNDDPARTKQQVMAAYDKAIAA